jgi:pimeloyl-ACP methyl ester carboxylesterase
VKCSSTVKKNKTPLPLRIIPWLFPKVEAIAPSLAHKYFIHLFYTPFHYKTPEKENEITKAARQFSISVNNKNIQCYRWGTMGPKIMLVHGWAGRAGQFRAIIPVLLAKGFQVVAFDGPAHGRSGGKQTNPVEFADVMKKLTEMEGPIYAIIAHSFGGVASLLAIQRGLPVMKLITIASPTIAEQVIGNYRRALNASAAAGIAFRKDLMKNYGITFEEISALHLIRHLPHSLDLLMIQDEKDPEIAVENATELKKVYPAADIFLTKGLGHTRILRDPAVIDRCLEFVTSDPVSRL